MGGWVRECVGRWKDRGKDGWISGWVRECMGRWRDDGWLDDE